MDLEKREYKNIPLEIKEIGEEGEFYIIKGYASTFGNIDLQGDVIAKGAFIESLKNNKIVMLWQHKMDEPVGVFYKAYEDEKGLFVEGRLPKDDEFVKTRVVPQLKIGSVGSFSVGFISKQVEYEGAKSYGGEDGKTVRVIKELDLFETSLVTMPANPLAVVTDFKSLQMLDEIDIDEKVRLNIKAKIQDKIKENNAQLDIKEVGNIECMKDIESILKDRAGMSQSERKILISKIKSYSREVTSDEETAAEFKKWAEEYELKQMLKNIISL